MENEKQKEQEKILVELVEKFISEQKPAPQEFEKVFKEHWEELLA